MKLSIRMMMIAAWTLAGTALLHSQFQLNRPIGQVPVSDPSSAPKPPVNSLDQATAATPDPSAATAATTPAAPASAPVVAADGNSATLEVTSDKAWIDAGIDIKAGDTVTITADGQIEFAAESAKSGPTQLTPKGVARGFRDLMRTYPVNDAARGALVAKFGSTDGARPFLVGAQWTGTAPVDGRLFLGLNQSAPAAADGKFQVQVAKTPGVASGVSVEVTDFPQERLDAIPRRVQDAAGSPGDRTNFIVIATRDRVREAFDKAGYVIVDQDKGSAVASALLATLSKKSYVTMPMSELMLFGRGQDFGYAQGDPLKVVATRHHFRLWQAPFDLQGRTVWVGAGTHDIGFDRDQRNNGITHKIDPEIDKEREFIVDALQHTGLVVKVVYKTPADPIKDAKTAHGEEFFSDGRTAIIYLQP